jgi:phasin
MSERNQSRKFVDNSAAVAKETLEKGKTAAEHSAGAVEQSYSVTAENIPAFSVKMIDVARANAEAGFDFARQLAAAKTPADIMELWTTHTRKQFEMLSDQTKELTALGQKMAGEGAELIARSVNQAFKKAS